MPRKFTTCLPLLVLLGAMGASAARGQVAPVNDTSVPFGSPDRPQPAATAPAQGAPVVRLLGWSFRNELDQSRLSHGDEVSLDPGHPEIILFFDATPNTGNGETEFRYRLDTYDTDWTVTREHVAHYRHLPPSNYRFRVQAHIAGQAWPNTQAELRVQQQPFFYQTWYAYLLVGMILLALSLQVLQQRDQLLKGQMGMVLQERNRIASECHDTLMAGFAAISWQLEATAKLFQDAVSSDHPAAQSCELARSMTAHCQAEARRIIWDLRDSDEITSSLSLALAGATSTYRERESPVTTLDIQGKEIPISPGAVHHLVCIGQEAVTNAIRHANPSCIRIKLTYEDELLRLSIRDDGRGFHLNDGAVRTGHFGIPVMEERARKLGGVLHLATSAGSGTEVSVTVSFHSIHQPARQQHDIVRWIGV
jgi:signal transduction histidine kinase